LVALTLPGWNTSYPMPISFSSGATPFCSEITEVQNDPRLFRNVVLFVSNEDNQVNAWLPILCISGGAAGVLVEVCANAGSASAAVSNTISVNPCNPCLVFIV